MEVLEALSRASVYIDFGNHPGKDRVPREAARAGAVVMLHHKGAARFFNDHPLSNHYLFSTDDVENGRLTSLVKTVLSDPETHLERQRYYRQKVALEKKEFYGQVESFFFWMM